MACKSPESKAIFKRFLENLIKELSQNKAFKTTTEIKHYIADEVLGCSVRTVERSLNSENDQQTKLFKLNNQIKLNL
jgi:hypothetical protein